MTTRSGTVFSRLLLNNARSRGLNFFSIALVILTFLVPKEALCAILRIDSTQSIVHTTDSYYLTWDTALPSDNIDIAIHGTFELVIERGEYDPFTGWTSPDRIHFNNIDVNISDVSGRTWFFPSYKGFYFEPDVAGSEDPCFGRSYYYYTGGTCWSWGNFGSYSGNYDGKTLKLIGGKEKASDAINGFRYTIVATAVPIPGTGILFLSGFSLLLLRLSKLTNIH